MTAPAIEHLIDRFEEEVESRAAARSVGVDREHPEYGAARQALVEHAEQIERDERAAKYVEERAAILATAVGIARLRLSVDLNPEAALDELDRAAQQTHDLLRESLIATGADPDRVDTFIGKRP